MSSDILESAAENRAVNRATGSQEERERSPEDESNDAEELGEGRRCGGVRVCVTQ